MDTTDETSKDISEESAEAGSEEQQVSEEQVSAEQVTAEQVFPDAQHNIGRGALCTIPPLFRTISIIPGA